MILKQHYTPGGFTHVFKRKGYEWDVGIHYIGGVQQENSPIRKLFDYISDGNLERADKKEYPLKGATEVWMKHMKPYMPKDRNHIKGKDSLINQMTFSFERNNVGFIVMNTDTYNPPTNQNPYGFEGLIPTKWISKEI